MIFKKLNLAFFIFLITFSYVHANDVVRILISTKPQEILLQGEFLLHSDSGFIKQIKDTHVPVDIQDNKIEIFNKLSFSSLYFKNNSKGFIKIGNYKYKGDLKIIANSNKIYSINHINIEEYIKGVLPNEISPKWHIEVLKAQAVAARTFAYYYIEKNKEQLYDLTDNTYAQVYKGIINENSNFNKAILETDCEVIVYKNELIQAFFHSVCGGHTENAGKVWGRHLPYLKGIPCSYCRDAAYYNWEAKFTEDEILKKLKANKYILESIRAIIPAKKSSSGRWVEVKIIGRGKSIIIPGNKFRIMFGIAKVRSTKFNVRRRGKEFIIKGKGWGHGVGLCQWGAKRMAEKGYKYYQILRYYYRGTRLKKISSIRNRKHE